ncbi:MAG: CopD family protein [bacterium]
MLPAINQWIHLTAAVVGLGGVVFIRLILFPVLQATDPDTAKSLQPRITARFVPVLWLCLTLLLLTGPYNIHILADRGFDNLPSAYLHALLAKLVLVVILFFSAAVATFPMFARFKSKRPALLLLNVVLGILILLLSAFLRRI